MRAEYEGMDIDVALYLRSPGDCHSSSVRGFTAFNLDMCIHGVNRAGFRGRML